MPEGHAAVRWAQSLAPLVGVPLAEVRMAKRWKERPVGLVGQHLLEPRTHGKHILLPLSGGETLHCHAGQYGSWQVGARPLALKKDPTRVRLYLGTQAHEAVFYNGPTAELLTPEELDAHERLNSLGPDVMAGGPGSPLFDRDEAARRVAARGQEPIKPVLMDQHVVAGIGNIFANEGLFLARVDPRRPAEGLSRDELERVWDATIPLMWEGTRAPGRTRTAPEALQAEGHTRWLYGRKGKPCHVCGTPVELVRLPPWKRATYLCPRCQS